MSRGARMGLLGVALVGCTFDVSGIEASDGGPPPDAPTSDAAIDAGPCPAPLQVALTVDGADAPVAPDAAFAQVLLGDTVALSAAGSCSMAPPLSYQWQISPIDGTRATALPSLTAETVTVYPVTPEKYTVSLTVSDAAGRTDTVQVFGFEAFGWQRLDGADGDVEDIDTGGGSLWVAARNGAQRVDLASPASGFSRVDDEAIGDALENDVGDVWFDADRQHAWFSRRGNHEGVWRVDYGVSPPVSNLVRYDGVPVLGAAATVADLGPHDPGLFAATNLGAPYAPQSTAFTGAFKPLTIAVEAVTAGGGQRWAGGTALWDVDGAGVEVATFGQADDKIRALAIDLANAELWVGSDGNGIARLDNGTGGVMATYTTETTALTTDKIRALAIETEGRFAGDVWVATDKGIARFKRDRGDWLMMSTTAGLAQRTDVRGIAVDEDAGRRVIYAGAKDGVVYIRAP